MPDGKLTDIFQCSLCGIEFRPHPTLRTAMVQEFKDHLRAVHDARGKPREAVNQAAARIAKEAD
jgi:hypothetical protein